MAEPVPHRIPFGVARELAQPTSEAELDDCRRLADTLAKMSVIRTALLRFEKNPAARITYAGGSRPKAAWGRWMWIQIAPCGKDFAWLGRLAAVEPAARGLIVVPRPDRLDASLAETAFRELDIPTLSYVKLGILFRPFQCTYVFQLNH